MDRTDLYRVTRALVDHFIARYAEPPAAIVLALDHSDDPTYGQQEGAFYHHPYQNHCYLPLFIFEGTSHALVTAVLRPGTRPPGADNAMIVVRLLSSLRHHWPYTHLLVRGDSHFATPEVIDVIASYRGADFVFGLAGNAVLLRQAAATLQEARGIQHHRVARAHAHGQAPPPSSRLYEELVDAARAWTQPWRVVLKAEVMQAGDNPRFVVTSLEPPPPRCSTKTSLVPVAIAQMIAKQGSMPSTATARRPPPSWPTPCGSSSRVPPLSCIMPYGRTPSTIAPSPKRRPRLSSSPSAKSPLKSNSTRPGCCSTSPVPVRSKRCSIGCHPCFAPSLNLSATPPNRRDASCREQRLPRPREPRRRGQRFAVAAPPSGRGARGAGRRDLLPSRQSPQNGSNRTKNLFSTLVHGRNTFQDVRRYCL